MKIAPFFPKILDKKPMPEVLPIFIIAALGNIGAVSAAVIAFQLVHGVK